MGLFLPVIGWEGTLAHFRDMVRRNECKLIGLPRYAQAKILQQHGWDGLEIVEILETIDNAWNDPVITGDSK